MSNIGPCLEQCPFKGCGQRCVGGAGHSWIKSAGRHFAEIHQCREHCWASLAERCEADRAQSRENRRECLEAGVGKCARCKGIIERLGV